MAMLRTLIWLGAVGAGVWLGRRLWPAIRTEPATWLGEDWREIVRERAGV